MAKNKNLKKTDSISGRREVRYFSTSFKKQKVLELEAGKIRICDLCKIYNVSDTAIYNWLNKYSTKMPKNERKVVELESDSQRLKFYQQRTAELERVVGQKQLQIDFYEQMFRLASEELGYDLKKKFNSQP